MGRKKQVQAGLVQDAPLNNEALAMVQNTAAIASEMSEERDLVNQLLGQAQMANAFAKFSETVSTSKLAYVKENKLYRALKGRKSGNGFDFLSGTWEEFCELLGVTARKVDMDIANLQAFGEEALDSMSRMGIGYREMRQYRRLPDDQKTALLEAAKTGDKESFIELAEELISKHVKEQESFSKQLADVKADYEIQGQLLAERTAEVDQARQEMYRAQHRIQKQSPAERSQALLVEAARVGIEFDLGLRGHLRAAFTELVQDADASCIDRRDFMAGTIRQLEITLAGIRSEFGLVAQEHHDDFRLADHAGILDQAPDWLRPDAENEVVEMPSTTKRRAKT
ncbi:hypothetical protein [Pseudomonas tohonis]|uniref:hypothetical protein n=1 Tax=Pseudomonas tohonis TaxID=2725477 RepID=UPI001F488B07|nr:hypothetical protein [Pseudomonas tohonis]